MMSKVVASLFLLLLAGSAAEPVEWLGPQTHDFGDILQNEAVMHEFRYRNTTDQPLIIDNIRAGCGCTTSDWAERPVPPDSIGIITVEYDAFSKGYFRKYVKVYFNGHRGAQKLWLEGFVEPK